MGKHTIIYDNMLASRSPEYSSYRNMLNRCSSVYAERQFYFDKGIAVCERWSGKGGFLRFFEDMGKKPSRQHSIDRADSSKGYYADNCSWATPHEQSLNRKLQSNNKSGYRGVSFYKPTSKWVAHIKAYEENKLISLGYFVSKEEAAFAYDIAALKLNGRNAKLNLMEFA